jgi:hypothetical protein
MLLMSATSSPWLKSFFAPGTIPEVSYRTLPPAYDLRQRNVKGG